MLLQNPRTDIQLPQITHVYLRETDMSNLHQSTEENKFLQDYISHER